MSPAPLSCAPLRATRILTALARATRIHTALARAAWVALTLVGAWAPTARLAAEQVGAEQVGAEQVRAERAGSHALAATHPARGVMPPVARVLSAPTPEARAPFDSTRTLASFPLERPPTPPAAGEARSSGTQRADPVGTRTTPRSALHDPRAEAALERGLAWLAAEQARETDGSFPATGLAAIAPGAKLSGDGAGQFAPVAVTSLCALAFMAGGSEPERGPHGRATARAVDWLVAHTDLDEASARYGYVGLSSDRLSRMHGHGFATLALAEAYVMSPKTERGARVGRALRAAVTCIERSQGVEGGWYYDPRPIEHESSITICVVQALRAARHAGFDVDTKTIARAVDYVARTQKPDGSFRYALGDDKSSVALTAAGISTLNAAGTYSGRVIEDGYDHVLRKLAARSAATGGTVDESDFQLCVFYERLYVAQALWQHADPRVFETWWREESTRVLVAQSREGSWSDRRYGDCYATAMNCLFLALPEGLLPIFQR